MAGLDGKVALVTGGSRGIGAAVARRLAADGADVAITYTSRPDAAEAVVAAIRATGRRALAIQADAADADAVIGAVDRVAAELGGLDILVNNAGIFVAQPIADIPLADFDRQVAVNIRGAFAATQAALRHMADGGRVITIGSSVRERVPLPGLASYALTKAAVAAMMTGLSREVGARGITANTVQPGPIDTDMNPKDGAFGDTMRGLLSLKRYGRPEEVAAAVAYLAGPDGAYVTGTTLTIDGGFAA